MTLDLGPIKERAALHQRVMHRDTLALVAEVEALRAALGAVQSETDQLAKDRYAEAQACDEAAKLLPYVPQGGDNRHSRARDAWLADYRARRAPKIGGGA